MDYHKIYSDLISSRKSCSVSGYSEKHHIRPRSLGGSDDQDNLIKLTAREHFVAHRLLAKMYGGGMWTAIRFMSQRSVASAQGVEITSRAYETIRIEAAKVHSELMTGSLNPRYGRYVPDEQRLKIKTAALARNMSGENNPNYGRCMSGNTKALIAFIRGDNEESYEVDYSVMDRIHESLGMIERRGSRGRRYLRKSVAMLQLCRYFVAKTIDRSHIDHSGERNPNYGKSLFGDKNHMFGKKHTNETKTKISKKALGRKISLITRLKISEKSKRKLECPHCHKVGGISNMKRYHFDNCKSVYEHRVTETSKAIHSH